MTMVNNISFDFNIQQQQQAASNNKFAPFIFHTQTGKRFLNFDGRNAIGNKL